MEGNRVGARQDGCQAGGRPTGSAGGIDGLAAGLQAPGTEGFAFWSSRVIAPLEGSGGR